MHNKQEQQHRQWPKPPDGARLGTRSSIHSSSPSLANDGFQLLRAQPLLGVRRPHGGVRSCAALSLADVPVGSRRQRKRRSASLDRVTSRSHLDTHDSCSCVVKKTRDL